MARHFTAASTQWIDTALGALNFDFGPGTVATICKVDSFTAERDIISVGAPSVSRLYLRTVVTTGQLNLQLGGVSANGPTLTAGKWYLIAASKASGTVLPRWTVYDYATNTFTHADGSATMANPGIMGTKGILGAQIDHSVPMDGDIAVAGYWNVVFTDQQREALAFDLNAWFQEQPRGLWVLDQPDPVPEPTKLLLHFDGANGVQNKPATAVGNAQVDTAQFRFGTSSLLFDGTGDYFTFADSADWDFGSGNFTIDCWVRFNNKATNANATFVSQYTDPSQHAFSFDYQNTPSELLRFVYSTGGTTNTNLTVAWSPNNNQWYHVAVVRSGANLYFFVDGMQVGATQNIGTDTIFNSTSTLALGGLSSASNYLNGWLDEVRISKGIARWTANFTPAGRPYDTDANTVLLVHGENTDALQVIHDSSAVNDAATQKGSATNGNAAITTAQSKFGGSSAVFDGTTDYLIFPASANPDFDFGAGDFTLECWVRFNSVAAGGAVIMARRPNGSSFSPFLIYRNGALLLFYASSNNTSWDIVSGAQFTATATTGVWYHLAVVRSGTQFMGFLDGQLKFSFTSSASLTANGVQMVIGADTDGTESFNGWIDEVRVSKGLARWTGNFTPPDAPYASDGNTTALLHMDGTDASTTFTDVLGHTFTAVGNAQIDTAQTKFGVSSALFDGTGDAITSPTSADWDFGSGDFSVECWYRTNSIAITTLIIGRRNPGAWGAWVIHQENNLVRLYASSNGTSWDIASAQSLGTIAAGTWYHIAVTRQGTIFRGYLNGVLGLLFSSSAILVNTAAPLLIGGESNGTMSCNGWIDEVRISKGISRWGNFILPTAAYTDPVGVVTQENVIDLSGGGANETSRSGTTQSVASVPVFSYGQ